MPLNPSDGAKAYVKDFKKSKAPQFKGKSDKKKQQMAIAAYLDDKDDQKESTMKTFKFKTHMMYDPKTGKGYEAKTKLDHLRMKKMGYSHDKPEPVEEAKSGTGYELYHKDFSSAMKHAYKHAKDKLKIEIDPEEIDKKVASGPRKPSSGKTNSYRLTDKSGKKGVQIQVANLDNKRYELNMYKESLDEGTLYENKSLKTLVSMGMLSKPNMTKVDRAMRGLKDPDGKALTSLVDGLVKVLSGGEMKEAVELDEKFRSARPSSKEVEMAIGIVNDPRYKGGNMTGAVKAIEKIRDGLSKYRDVAAALQKANENLEEGKMKEAVELDENKSLIKDYEKYMSQGNKKDSNAIDYLMSMPKYKRMSKDQMAKAIGDHKRKGIFREETSLVELDEASKTIDKVKDIVARKQAMKIDGVMVDMFTASAISQIYDKVNDANKKKMDGLKVTKLADIAMKMLKRESTLDEAFSPKEIKMAIGMAADPRFSNNMTGAVKAIEKLKKGLSSHKQVAAVLKRKNENTADILRSFIDYK